MLDSVSDDHCCVPEIERVFAALSLPVRPTSATTRAEALTFGALETFNAVAELKRVPVPRSFFFPMRRSKWLPPIFFFFFFFVFLEICLFP